MRAYILSVIGAAILSAMASIISPEKWRGYVRVITGLVIICCIISPFISFAGKSVWKGFDDSFNYAAQGEDLQGKIVRDELKKRINTDIEERMKSEFGLDITADCDIAVNNKGEIEGVREIRVYGDKLTAEAIKRLREVYGIQAGGVRNG